MAAPTKAELQITATDQTKAAFDSVKRSMESLRKGAEVLGIALGVGAFAEFIKHSLEAQEKLANLSKSTGIAVETLGGLGFAAKQSGSDLEGVALAAGKLNVNIAKAAAGNEESGAAFKAMGVSVRDAGGNIKSADVLLAQIADKFEKYKDGPNKAALAHALFGKSFASMIPLLDEGGAKLTATSDYWKQYSNVSKDSTERAKAVNEEFGKLHLHLEGLGNVIANELSGPLLHAAEALTKFEEKAGIVSAVAKGFAELFKVVTVTGANVAYVFTKIGEEASGMAQQLNALAHFDFKKFQDIGSEMRKRAVEDRKAIDEFSERVINPPKEAPPPKREGGKKVEAPGLPDKGAADKALAEEKARLEQRLHDVKNYVNAEAELLKSRNAANAAYYEQGLISIRRFFQLEGDAQADAIDKQRREFHIGEDALRDFIALETKKGNTKDVIEARTKLADLLAKQAKIEQEAAEKGTQAWFAQQQALKAFQDTVTDTSVQLLELAGRSGDAARKQIADLNSIKQARAKLVLERGEGSQAVKEFDALNREKVVRADISDVVAKESLVKQELANQERDIASAVQSGAITELEALAKTDAAFRQAAASLTEYADQQERLAKTPEAIQAVRNLRSEIKALAATADESTKRMRVMLEDSLVQPLLDFVHHTKSAGQAFLDFAKNIETGLSRIAAQELAKKIFGVGGDSGGFAGIAGKAAPFLANLFGGGASVATQAATTQAASVQATNFVSAGAAGFALGGIMTPHGALELKRYASGGIANRPQLALYGEGRQNEAYVPLPDGRRIPVNMKGGGAGVVQHLTINIATPDAQSFKKSESQVITSLAMSARRAMARR